MIWAGFKLWSKFQNTDEQREMTGTSSSSSASSSTTTISEDLPADDAFKVKGFFASVGIHASLPQNSTSKDFYSDLLRDLLKADHVQRGHVSCIVPVLPVVGNYYNGLHGGAVGAIAERVSVACARTVVADDKELFLGELSISYLSAAKLNEVLVVEGSVVRSGRNLTVVASEFRIKKTRKLAFTSRATFYHMPAAKL